MIAINQVRDNADKHEWHYIYSNNRALIKLYHHWNDIQIDQVPLCLISSYLSGESEASLCSAFVSLLGDASIGQEDLSSPLAFLASVEDSCRELTRCYLHGNEKYSRGNFKAGAPVCSYLDSAIRHLKKIVVGDVIDPTSDCAHWAHAAWNIWQALDQPPERDNRLRP